MPVCDTWKSYDLRLFVSMVQPATKVAHNCLLYYFLSLNGYIYFLFLTSLLFTKFVGLSDHLVLHPLDIEGVVEDSISSSWKSHGLALLQVECYLMLHSMVVYLSRNLNFCSYLEY